MTSLPPPSALVRPLLLGVVTGARSQLGLLALALSRPRPHERAAVRRLQTRAGRAGTALGAAGELVADKLPRTPHRLSPPVFAGRLLSGAMVGGLAAERRDAVATGLAATAGALGAGVAAWAGSKARTMLPQRTGTPDLPWALVEDAAAIGLAAALRDTSSRRRWWDRLRR
jgi:uncharacterized membrane protein